VERLRPQDVHIEQLRRCRDRWRRVEFASRLIPDSDTRPFYGRVVGAPDRRTLETNGEVGPFYGRVLPNEFFGSARGRRSAGPFYGRGGN